MARKNPVSRLAETAISTLKDPKTAAGKAVDQAKGTVALGKHVAEAAGSVAGQVVGRAAARRGGQAPSRAGTTSARPTSPPDLRSVPEVNEAGQTTSPAARSTAPAKKHGDVLPTPSETGGAAAEAPAKKAPAQKAPAKKAPAKKASAKKTPAKKVTATPADVAEVVESAVAESPEKTAARPVRTSAAKKAGAKAPTKKPAKKTPAKKASSPGDKLPSKKTQSAGPDTEPLVDPSTTKQVAGEAQKLQRAADPEPGNDVT